MISTFEMTWTQRRGVMTVRSDMNTAIRTAPSNRRRPDSCQRAVDMRGRDPSMLLSQIALTWQAQVVYKY